MVRRLSNEAFSRRDGGVRSGVLVGITYLFVDSVFIKRERLAVVKESVVQQDTCVCPDANKDALAVLPLAMAYSVAMSK